MFQPRTFTKGDDNNPILVGKEKELYESKNWPKSFSKQVDVTKIKIDAFKPWITRRVSELMGIEDDIVVDYCMSQLKELGEFDAKRNSQLAGDGGAVFNEKPRLDPKRLQISLTGFMAKKASIFVRELWDLLLSAQESEHGIPQSFIDERKKELESQEKEREKEMDRERETEKEVKRSPSHHSKESDDYRHRKRDHSDNYSSSHVKRDRRERRPDRERSRRYDRRERRRHHRRHRDRSRSPRSASPKRRRSSSSDSHHRRSTHRRRSRSRDSRKKRRSPDSSSSSSSSSSTSSSSERRRKSHRKRTRRYHDSSSSSVDPERVKELSRKLARGSSSS